MPLESHNVAKSTKAMESENTVECVELEKEEMGSVNHSITQTNLAISLSSNHPFRVMTELSLDIGNMDLTPFGLKAKKELKSDVCVYPIDAINGSSEQDIVRMPDMPLLAIEVLSPEQGINELMSKIRAYFALGVKSCWLVLPIPGTITVYSAPGKFRTFVPENNEVVDEVADIRLPIKNIFSWLS